MVKSLDCSSCYRKPSKGFEQKSGVAEYILTESLVFFGEKRLW